jgi:hypothetical protein
MKRCVFLAAVFVSFFAACASVERPAEKPPEKPPASPQEILGAGVVSAGRLGAFLRENNPGLSLSYTQEIAALYIEEAADEGVNHDVAFCQMCLETGFLRFGGLVQPEWNNFCGLGAIDAEHPGERFPDSRTGIRAHVQHLKGYASPEPLRNELVDPRYRWIKYGSAPDIFALAGKWASDREYGGKIKGLLDRLYLYSFE